MTRSRYTDEKKLAEDARAVQSACNLAAVLGAAHDGALFLSQHLGTDAVRAHPAMRLFASKVAHLTGMQADEMATYAEADNAITTLLASETCLQVKQDLRPSLLPWHTEGSGYWMADLHNFVGGDGARFHLELYPSCYRRGPWRLLIEVAEGPSHHLWGCFDEADQPLRNYHDEGVARGEAQRIADVLWRDRFPAPRPEGT
jgi:hypothetical protein